MKKRRILTYLILFSLLFSLVYFITNSKINNKKDTYQYNLVAEKLALCYGQADECYRDEIKNIGNLDILTLNKIISETLIKKSEDGYCHRVIHELGLQEYSKVDLNKEIKPYCGGALIHALMTVYGRNKDERSLALLMKNSCIKVNPEIQIDCFHGIGHALNRISQGRLHPLQSCESYISGDIVKNKSVIVGTCMEGFLMESTALVKVKNTYLPAYKNQNFPDEEIKNICFSPNTENFENCKTLLYRFDLRYKAKNFEEIKKYLDENCSKTNTFCQGEVGVISYLLTELNPENHINYPALLCSKEELRSCLGHYFLEKRNSLIMDESEININKFCLAFKPEYKTCIEVVNHI